MESPRLIQRLKAPSNNAITWAFPSTRTGLFSQEQIRSLTPILTFDYMGSSNFEFGKVRDAINMTYKFFSENLGTYGQIDLQKPIFYLTSRSLESDVKKFLTQLSQNGDNHFIFEKPTYLKETLDNRGDDSKYKGWIELNNPFMFFTDQEMYEGIKSLLNIK